MNQINNANEHFASQYEFWKKYGAVIVFGLTIIFLIIIATMTYQHLEKIAEIMIGKLGETNSILGSLVDKMAGKPPA
jgi:hypothetical protein